MQAGELKHRITINHNVSDGTTDPDWQPLFTFIRDGITCHDLAAAKKALTGRLYYAAAAAQSENEVIFTIRYKTDIKPTMQIVDETAQPYEITSEPVNVADGKQWLEIHAKKIDANGG